MHWFLCSHDLICLLCCRDSGGHIFRLCAAEPAAKVDQIIVVFKTHFDIGYTDMAKNVVERYRTTMIDQALEVCDRNRDLPAQQQFVWTLPGWPMSQIMADWPGQTAQREAADRAGVEGGPIRRARAAVHHAHGTVGAGGSRARTRFRLRRLACGEYRAATRREDDGRSVPFVDHADVVATRGDRVSALGLQRRQPFTAGPAVVLVGRSRWFPPAHDVRRRRLWHRAGAAGRIGRTARGWR